MKNFVIFAIALLPAVWCASLNLLNLSSEEARNLLASQSQTLTFAKKISSLPLPEQPQNPVPVIYFRGRPIKDFSDFYEDNYEASQFHGQDGEGRYSFGFSAPHHARFETRNGEGEVRGSYKYLGPYEQPVEVEYWADKDGFHQRDNLGLVGPAPVEETPEVKEARLEHLRLWHEAAALAAEHPDPLSDEYNKGALAYDAAQEKIDHETEYNKPSDELTRYPKLPYSEHIKPTSGNSQEGIVIENAATKSSDNENTYEPKGFFYSFTYPVGEILLKENKNKKEVIDEKYAEGKKPFPVYPMETIPEFATSVKSNMLKPHFKLDSEVPQESIIVESVQTKNILAKLPLSKRPIIVGQPEEIQIPVQIIPVSVVKQSDDIFPTFQTIIVQDDYTTNAEFTVVPTASIGQDEEQNKDVIQVQSEIEQISQNEEAVEEKPVEDEVQSSVASAEENDKMEQTEESAQDGQDAEPSAEVSTQEDIDKEESAEISTQKIEVLEDNKTEQEPLESHLESTNDEHSEEVSDQDDNVKKAENIDDESVIIESANFDENAQSIANIKQSPADNVNVRFSDDQNNGNDAAENQNDENTETSTQTSETVDNENNNSDNENKENFASTESVTNAVESVVTTESVSGESVNDADKVYFESDNAEATETQNVELAISDDKVEVTESDFDKNEEQENGLVTEKNVSEEKEDKDEVQEQEKSNEDVKEEIKDAKINEETEDNNADKSLVAKEVENESSEQKDIINDETKSIAGSEATTVKVDSDTVTNADEQIDNEKILFENSENGETRKLEKIDTDNAQTEISSSTENTDLLAIENIDNIESKSNENSATETTVLATNTYTLSQDSEVNTDEAQILQFENTEAQMTIQNDENVEQTEQTEQKQEEHPERESKKIEEMDIEKAKQEISNIVQEIKDVVNKQAFKTDETSKQVQSETIARADSLINAMKEYFHKHGYPIDIHNSEQLKSDKEIAEEPSVIY